MNKLVYVVIGGYPVEPSGLKPDITSPRSGTSVSTPSLTLLSRFARLTIDAPIWQTSDGGIVYALIIELN